MLTIIIYTICIIGLVIAAITDIKTREVPDWLNFSLISAGLGLNLLFTVMLHDFRYIIDSVAGFLAFFIIAMIMFYTGQWGGGDSKILMGLGALLGLDLSLRRTVLIDFVINCLIVGAVYGLLWSCVLTIKKWKGVVKEAKRISRSKKIIVWKKILFLFVLIIILLILLKQDLITRFFLLSLLILSIATFYLGVYIKAVEKSAMLKYVTPNKLTEGDWIARDVVVNRKRICGPKDLGISREQIKELVSLYRKKRLKKVLIKEGIPFVPSFLIAFIVTLIVGNLLILVLSQSV
ncbi:A24 family peptidase [Candidatus Woesearchaeota archaeon]|nr:A24 family peptidase [Candidatus Woesearchaeota archaeon]